MGLFSKKSYVGIDLGHYMLKAVQVERTPGGWRVFRSVTAVTPADTMKDGVVIDPAVLGLALKQMLRKGHISADSAVIAVGGGSVVVRPVRIPKMAESALRKSIKFEASRYVPNSVEDSFIDFEIAGYPDDSNMDVLVAAAPKDVVESRVAACEAAGLDVEVVEIGSFAIHRALVQADHRDDISDKTVAIINLGSHQTGLSILHKGAFSMTRSIQSGGQVFTEQLKTYFKLSDEDAESGKAQLNLTALLQEDKAIENPPLRVIQPHLDDLIREVRRSFNYWQSQLSSDASDKQVDSIILTGGGAALQGIGEYFTHKLGIPSTCKGVFDNPRLLGPEGHASGYGLGVAVGLAMGVNDAKAGRVATNKPGTEDLDTSIVETPGQQEIKSKGKKGKKAVAAVEPPEIAADVEGAPEPTPLGVEKPAAKAKLGGLFKKKQSPVQTLADVPEAVAEPVLTTEPVTGPESESEVAPAIETVATATDAQALANALVEEAVKPKAKAPAAEEPLIEEPAAIQTEPVAEPVAEPVVEPAAAVAPEEPFGPALPAAFEDSSEATTEESAPAAEKPKGKLFAFGKSKVKVAEPTEPAEASVEGASGEAPAPAKVRAFGFRKPKGITVENEKPGQVGESPEPGAKPAKAGFGLPFFGKKTTEPAATVEPVAEDSFELASEYLGTAPVSEPKQASKKPFSGLLSTKKKKTSDDNKPTDPDEEEAA